MHRCPVGGRGVLGVMSDFRPIDMKFGMEVEFDALNDYPKFDHDQLISSLVGVLQKNSANPLPLCSRSVSYTHLTLPTIYSV